jgi:HK97 family phage major capsid protein
MRNQDIMDRLKSDIAVGDLITNGGYLNTAQSNMFIRMLIEQPTMINIIRTVPMNTPKMEINKIGFTSRILKAAPSAGTALGATDRSKPTTEKVTLATEEVIAEVHIPYDVLEDNIERGNLEDTIMALIAQRASLDLEELVLQGDTNSGDSYLALMNGLIVQTTSNVVDYSAYPVGISKSVFKAGLKAMPNKYLRNRAAMGFYVAPHTEIELAHKYSDRETALGDNKLTLWTPTPIHGIPVVPVALMPSENYLLTDPKNVILGIQRQIMIETDRDIRTRVLIVVLTMRIDVKYEEEEAAVLCKGLDPDYLTTTTTS